MQQNCDGDKTYGLLDHPYWHKILGLPEHGLEMISYVPRILSVNREARQEFLSHVAAGFYPLSALAPRVFYRASELTTGNGQELARHLYEVEMGEHAFVKGTKFDDVPHAEQYRMLIESLEEGCRPPIPTKKSLELANKVNIYSASLDEVLAYASVIEHSAKGITDYIREFVAQWQVYTGRRSGEIKYNYLDEHGLTEGSGKGQHESMVKKMIADRVINQQVLDKASRRLVDAHHEQASVAFADIIRMLG
jgi:hypothetical protein